MEFPFQVGLHDRQTQKEKDHITKFHQKTQVEFTYTNKSDEKRKVLRVFLPLGAVTEDTIYFHEKKGTFYHTPLAKFEGELGKVIYEDGKGKSHDCDSKEWLKWLGDGEVEHTPNAQPEPDPNKAAIIKMGVRAAKAREVAGIKSKLSEEADKDEVGFEKIVQVKK